MKCKNGCRMYGVFSFSPSRSLWGLSRQLEETFRKRRRGRLRSPPLSSIFSRSAPDHPITGLRGSPDPYQSAFCQFSVLEMNCSSKIRGEANMLIRKPIDIKSSEITPKSTYLNRRKFITGAAVTGAAVAAGLYLRNSESGPEQTVEASNTLT